MRDNKTVNILHLLDVLQAEHGAYPLGRLVLVTWLSAELEKTPGDAGVRQIQADYPAHLGSLRRAGRDFRPSSPAGALKRGQ